MFGTRRKKLIALVVIVGAMWAGLAVVNAAEESESITVSEEILIHAKPTPGSPIVTVRGQVELAHTTVQVMSVLSDVTKFTKFMNDLAEAKLLKKTKKADGSEVSFVYQRLDLTAISDRDFVVRAVTRQKSTASGKRFDVRFKATDKIAYPKKSGVVRVKTLKGQWLVEPIKNGKATRLTFIRHIEMGGMVPNFLVNRGQKKSMLATLKKLRSYCGKIL